jgi:hypothetical protein
MYPTQLTSQKIFQIKLITFEFKNLKLLQLEQDFAAHLPLGIKFQAKSQQAIAMKIPFLKVTAFALLLVGTIHSHAQSLKDAKVAFKAGNWKVVRSIDPMKDTASCTGIYKENYTVQLTPDSLFIGVQGGVDTVTLRYGDKPARGLRLAQEMEKKIRSVILSGNDFNEIAGSGRLRYQVSTLVSGIKTDEIDLDGFEDALSNIRAGCSLQTEVAVQPKASPPEGSMCTGLLVERMRVQGIKDVQIQAICR